LRNRNPELSLVRPRIRVSLDRTNHPLYSTNTGDNSQCQLDFFDTYDREQPLR
jgi:hypothetical protein